MKSVLAICMLFSSAAVGQEQAASDWKIMPDIAVIKLLPVGRQQTYYPQPLIYPGNGFVPYPSFTSEKYAGTGLEFTARFFNNDIEPFVLTLSAGASWYYPATDEYAIPAYGPSVIGNPPDTVQRYYNAIGSLGYWGAREFVSFPLGVGIQFVYPYASAEKLMFFAGAEGNLHFTSQRFDWQRESVQAGYTLLGGFAIKFAEFAVRYTSFAGINNIGVQAGVRFKQFDL